MADRNLVPVLQEAGFEPVDTELPGGWSTDGQRTVVVYTENTPGRLSDRHHRVFVYDAPASDIGVDANLLARATDTSNELAIRRALDQADTDAARNRLIDVEEGP